MMDDLRLTTRRVLFVDCRSNTLERGFGNSHFSALVVMSNGTLLHVWAFFVNEAQSEYQIIEAMAKQQEVGGGTNTTIVNVLIIAHPDDESMFFVPMLYNHHLQHSRNHRTTSTTCWIVCLTTGDYDGLGVTRTAELRIAIHILSSSTHDEDEDATATNHNNRIRIIQLDRPDICADHPKQAWNVENVAKVLAETLRDITQQSVKVELELQQQQQLQQEEASPPLPPSPQLRLFTFDRDGVSGHWNHRDTYFAVRHLLFLANYHHGRSRRPHSKATVNDDEHDDVDAPTTTTTRSSADLKLLPIESVWCLVTVHNPWRKYVPLFEWVRLLWQYLMMTAVGRDNGPSSSWTWCDKGPRRRQEKDEKEEGDDDDDEKNENDPVICYRLLRPMLNWRLMRAHATQFVWYRRLFVIFSCYTYCNRFRKMRR
jgi:N-acetylglucosaminylphosphatidylinositol deacetylase